MYIPKQHLLLCVVLNVVRLHKFNIYFDINCTRRCIDLLWSIKLGYILYWDRVNHIHNIMKHHIPIIHVQTNNCFELMKIFSNISLPYITFEIGKVISYLIPIVYSNIFCIIQPTAIDYSIGFVSDRWMNTTQFYPYDNSI